MMQARRLPLPGLHNLRDLGGYATADGRATKFGVFLRSEAPCNLPQETVQKLLDYGVKATADVRGAKEQVTRPSSLREAMEYHTFCLAGKAESFSLSTEIIWEEIYIARAEDNRDWTKAVVEQAANQEGAILFHCTTGKDRTGVIACYLLSIAGVSREDIAADYALSQAYLQPVFQGMRDGTLNIGRGDGIFHPTVFQTPSEAMFRFQDYLIETYGSVVEYLKTAGVTEETLATIRKKFVENISMNNE